MMLETFDIAHIMLKLESAFDAQCSQFAPPFNFSYSPTMVDDMKKGQETKNVIRAKTEASFEVEKLPKKQRKISNTKSNANSATTSAKFTRASSGHKSTSPGATFMGNLRGAVPMSLPQSETISGHCWESSPTKLQKRPSQNPIQEKSLKLL